MSDRRAKTSRANLGDHVPKALDPEGTVVVAVRLPRRLLRQVEEAFAPGTMTRSEAIRELLTDGLLRLSEYH